MLRRALDLRTVVNTAMDLRFPRKAGNFLITGGTVSFSRKTLFHEVSLSITVLVTGPASEEFPSRFPFCG
jgi:hypothetical protein